MKRFFGADLAVLAGDDHDLPIILNRLLITIEVKALFVEGIYRKSGALAVVRNTRTLIETTDGNFCKKNFNFRPYKNFF